METPIAEYEKLRGEKKLDVSSLAVKAGAAGVVVKDLGAAGATMDIELEVSVPDKWEKGASVAIGVRCEKSVACEQGMVVTLTHSGWEALGDEGAKTRDGYYGGWVGVLERFVEAA